MAEEKLERYEGFVGRVHHWRDHVRSSVSNWMMNGEHSDLNVFYQDIDEVNGRFAHLYRRKSNLELIRISAVIAGIELSYAAETAFVSPILLQIGIKHRYISLVWAISPILGFLLCPILGSLSDGCQLSWGRRRPFILLLSSGLFLGLLLVPNGKYLGSYFGDEPFHDNVSLFLGSGSVLKDRPAPPLEGNSHSWAIVFTVLGTVLLDSMADSCQSPARSYLVDICHPEDHARGLSTFTIMAGLGGSLGYTIGAIDWGASMTNNNFGVHVQIVFAMITIVFVLSVTLTVTSFQEIPLNQMKSFNSLNRGEGEGGEGEGGGEGVGIASPEHSMNDTKMTINLLDYLRSILFMPNSIRMICLTNLFCWMAHVCYSLYFTDFVGEVIFEGNPTAAMDSPGQRSYNRGVRFGCWGMALYSLSCALYSLAIERLLKRHGARLVYVGGLLVYSGGMLLMVLTCSKISVIVLSGAAGIMYATVFTMPYILVVHYHVQGVFEVDTNGQSLIQSKNECRRGLGTDIAIVNSMIFLAQFLLSLILSVVNTLSGSISAVILLASLFSFCAAISASQIMFLKL